MEKVAYIGAAFVISSGLIPLIIKISDLKGWHDPVNSRKMHTDKVPRLGNLGIVPAFIIIAALRLLQAGGLPALLQYLPILGAGIFVFAVGLLDDFIELSAVAKFIFQCAGCAVPPLFGFRWTHFGPLELGVFSLPLTFLWLIGLVNAYNLIDGIDALCGGLSFLSLAALATIFYMTGVDATLPLILCGGILGFLFYNKPKAKIFLGDGGSQFLGFMIAAFPLCAVADTGGNTFPVAAVLASIPILDTIAAIWRRTRDKVSFLKPDKAHLHHKLLALGYSTAGILFFLYIMQIILCAGSILILARLNDFHGFLLCLGLYAVMGVFFSIIHYTYTAVKLHYPPTPRYF
ncbi:MAG: undecaprenyl/decaprenyl-phosphate alpha-N-acetylglucosaminyl 1-phosphate transferase [Spirochaetaceae bacterium]|jgi:UDP-GlcNAc:undecaprenyl-phosphate GlcNAc-1-phosphate transferase|nr:undecaprenyl/decaprenyl-phosphate alpha-N-acetylglucosaminyl 1-phosphate transferase [Spirochaetaceae bacterium]